MTEKDSARMLANLMFSDQTGQGLNSISQNQRDGWPIWLSEVIATIGLLLVIHSAVRHGKPYVVVVQAPFPQLSR
jgi:hypothetical protein